MNRFLEACGATSPWRLIIESNGAPVPELTSFETPYLVVGQDQAADLCLRHKDVSERHAFLQWIAGRLRVTDLGSRTGVLYQGRRQRVGWLDPGQSARIGPYRLALADHETACRFGEPRTIPALGLEMKLRGIRAASARAEGPLVVLGSAPDCEVRLLDPAVTSYHCAIVNSPLGSWVVDLLGAGGMTLNGRNTRTAPLSEGDVLVVGRSTVRVASIEWLEHSEAALPPNRSQPPVEPEPGKVLARVEAVSETTPARVASDAQLLVAAPIHMEPLAAVVHHPAHEHVAPLASYLEPPPPPAETGGPAAPAEAAAEPRRVGFFTAWRRVPVAVPNRSPGAPSPRPTSVDELPPPAPGRRAEPGPVAPPWESPPASTAHWEDPAAARSSWFAPPSPSFESTFSSGPESPERRGSCRYPISGRTAQISWWEAAGPQKDRRPGALTPGAADPNLNGTGGTQNRTMTVSMVDVSQAGLAVLSPVAPPRGERVWFRLDDELALDWVELIAVGHSSAGNGRRLVRFAFRENCPYDLFKTLVFTGGSSRS